jgi:hypothetical protein
VTAWPGRRLGEVLPQTDAASIERSLRRVLATGEPAADLEVSSHAGGDPGEKRWVRRVAVWRRPKLVVRCDPDHDHVVAGAVARLIELPRRAVVCAEDETHLNWLPHVRASWTRRGARPKIPTPGKNRQVTVYGAIEVTTGRWVYRLGQRPASSPSCGCSPRPSQPPRSSW